MGADLVVGIGVDLVDVGRIERALARWSDTFVRRTFSPAELCVWDRRDPTFVAAAVSLKEASYKAAFGLVGRTGWHDVELLAPLAPEDAGGPIRDLARVAERVVGADRTEYLRCRARSATGEAIEEAGWGAGGRTVVAVAVAEAA
jgi:phosphopantetheinyl transferase (holo-ACP synthase)